MARGAEGRKVIELGIALAHVFGVILVLALAIAFLLEATEIVVWPSCRCWKCIVCDISVVLVFLVCAVSLFSVVPEVLW